MSASESRAEKSDGGQISRRIILKTGLSLSAAGALAPVLAACSSSSSSSSGSSRQGSGSFPTLTAALGADPQALDYGTAYALLTQMPMQHVFEGLFALDEHSQPHPLLATSYQKSSDGLTYTIKLRSGIKFHDGSTMTSGDVVASINRWLKLGTGTGVAPSVKSVTAASADTVVISMKREHWTLIIDLAGVIAPAIIMPAKIIAAAGGKPLPNDPSKLVGTGPYKLSLYTPGESMTLTRFPQYQSVTTPSSDWAGAKHAYARQIVFPFVTDSTQRLNGLETGQYDWIQSVDPQQLPGVAANPALVLKASGNVNHNELCLNTTHSGLVFSKLEARQALNMLLDKHAIATATFGPSVLWSPLSGALESREVLGLYSSAGLNLWAEHNPSKAKALFAKAGVTSSSAPIRILSSKTPYPQFNEWSVAVQAALTQIGIKSSIEVFDYTTAAGKAIASPESWDLFPTSSGGSYPDATLIDEFYAANSPFGFTPTPQFRSQITSLLSNYESAGNEQSAQKYVDQIQQAFLEEMSCISLGLQADANPYSSKLNLGPVKTTSILWNAQLTT